MKVLLALLVAIVVPGGLVLLALHYGHRYFLPSQKLAAGASLR